MKTFKGEWITNCGKVEREAYVKAGFIVCNPKATQFATEEQLIAGGIIGVYVNPFNPNAKMPTEEELKFSRMKVYSK